MVVNHVPSQIPDSATRRRRPNPAARANSISGVSHPVQDRRQPRPTSLLSTGFPAYLWHRFNTHILVTLFLDTSRLMQPRTTQSSTTSQVQPFLVGLQWMVVLLGALTGGATAGGVTWIAAKIFDYSWILAFGILGALVLLGPDYVPPLTPMNGCKLLRDRFLSTVLIGLGGIFMKYRLPQTLHGISKVVWTVSALWHAHQGDTIFRISNQHLVAHLQHLQHENRQEDYERVLTEAPRHLMIHYFRSAAGVGMILTTFELYSWTIFLALLGLLVGSNLLFYYASRIVYRS